MIIFDGDQLAATLEEDLKQDVTTLRDQGSDLKISAILFEEDAGSRLYTQLKKEAAQRVGIEYEVHIFSMADGTDEVVEKLLELNQDAAVTGIIIQKPWRNTWSQVKGISHDKGTKAVRQAFNAWWEFLTAQIDQKKDVDGLHPETLLAIKERTHSKKDVVLPATAQAVMVILNQAFKELKIDSAAQKKLQILVLGRSDIVGQPVFYELDNNGFQVKMLTRDDVRQRLDSNKKFLDADVVISATGVNHLITGEMVKENSIIIDVGEPRPDVDLESMENKVAFITPVPGGVGPMTVVSLLKNCVTISAQ